MVCSLSPEAPDISPPSPLHQYQHWLKHQLWEHKDLCQSNLICTHTYLPHACTVSPWISSGLSSLLWVRGCLKWRQCSVSHAWPSWAVWGSNGSWAWSTVSTGGRKTNTDGSESCRSVSQSRYMQVHGPRKCVWILNSCLKMHEGFELGKSSFLSNFVLWFYHLVVFGGCMMSVTLNVTQWCSSSH